MSFFSALFCEIIFTNQSQIKLSALKPAAHCAEWQANLQHTPTKPTRDQPHQKPHHWASRFSLICNAFLWTSTMLLFVAHSCLRKKEWRKKIKERKEWEQKKEEGKEEGKEKEIIMKERNTQKDWICSVNKGRGMSFMLKSLKMFGVDYTAFNTVPQKCTTFNKL